MAVSIWMLGVAQEVLKALYQEISCFVICSNCSKYFLQNRCLVLVTAFWLQTLNFSFHISKSKSNQFLDTQCLAGASAQEIIFQHCIREGLQRVPCKRKSLLVIVLFLLEFELMVEFRLRFAFQNWGRAQRVFDLLQRLSEHVDMPI